MNNYETKQANRITRMRQRAERIRATANELIERGRADFARIPFGQPMMPDHHSYKRDRNYRQRAGRRIDKGMVMLKQAEALERAADAAEKNNSISGFDPDAIEKLTRKVAELEHQSARMKIVNKAWRRLQKGKPIDDFELTDQERRFVENFEPEVLVPQPYPSYSMSNLRARIRNAQKRIDDLLARSNREDVSISGDGWTITNGGDDRLWIQFDSKPDRETCQFLRSKGWKWSRSRTAWVRMDNASGRWSAKVVAKHLTEMRSVSG